MLQFLTCLLPSPARHTDLSVVASQDITDSPCERGCQDKPIILVVDDDSAIRRMAAMVLELRGFKTLVASNGLEALQQLQQHPEVGVVLLDLFMPIMDGAEAFREMRKLCPSRPVIITSGFPPSETRTRFGDPAPDAFVQKPFNVAMLTSALRGTLN